MEGKSSVTASGEMATKKDGAVGSLARGLAILSLFDIANPHMSFADIAQDSGLPKPTVHRLLKALTEMDFLVLDAFNKKYFPGPRVMTLGFAAANVLGLVDKARPEMLRICRAVNQTVGLSIRDKTDIVMCHRELPLANAINVNMPIGTRVAITRSGAGRLHIAFATPAPGEAPLHDQIVATLKDKAEIEALERHVAFAREHRFSYNDEEVAQGFRAVTVPLWQAGDTIAACLNLAAPSNQMTMKGLIDLAVPELAQAAASISTILGASREFLAENVTTIEGSRPVVA